MVTQDINGYHWENGHANEGYLRMKAANEEVVLTGSLQAVCTGCKAGKNKRQKIPKIGTWVKEKEFLGRLFVDWTGPLHAKTKGRKGKRGANTKYLLYIVDEATESTFMYHNKRRGEKELLRSMRKFVVEQVMPGDKMIKIIRSDGGKEFASEAFEEWLGANGIRQEFSSDYTPQHNSIVERVIWDTKCLTVTMMNGANLSARNSSYCGYALDYAVLQWNEVYKSAVKMSPNEARGIADRPLHQRYLFGSRALVHNESKELLGEKVLECIFVGFAPNKPAGEGAFICLATGAYLESRNYTVLNGCMLLNTDKYIFEDTDIFENIRVRVEDPEEIWRSSTGEIQGEVPLHFDYEGQLREAEAAHHYQTPSIPEFSEEDANVAVMLRPFEEDVEELECEPNESLVFNARYHKAVHCFTARYSSQGERELVTKSSDSDEAKRVFVIRRPTEESTKEAVDDVAFRVFISKHGDVSVPKSYRDAMKSPQCAKWKDAIKSEFDSLVANNTWEKVDAPKGVKIVGSRWCFDLKFNAEGEITRYKARFVVQGFSQTLGLDYFETYAPVVHMNTVRTVLALAATYDWNTVQMDVETAFLNAFVKEDIYVRQSEGHIEPGDVGKVYKLKKSLYGLKQSPRNWNNTITEFLLELGFEQSEHDACLFMKRDQAGIVILALYVDDLIMTGDNKRAIEWVRKSLSKRFKMKDLGSVSKLLGMVVERDREAKAMKISQEKYIEDMLRQFPIPDGMRVKGRRAEMPSLPDTYNKYVESVFGGVQRSEENKQFPYREIIGCLMFLANATRPDISNIVRFLSSFVVSWTDIHVKFIYHVLQYLEGTASYGLHYQSARGDGDINVRGDSSKYDKYDFGQLLSGYSDASWADNYADATSTSGVCVMIGLCLVTWKSLKQRVIARSTMESEYIAMSQTVDEVMFIRNILLELQLGKKLDVLLANGDEGAKKCIDEAVACYNDNEAAICVGNQSMETKRSRHINLKFHNVKEQIREGRVKFSYVCSKENKADFFTKCLDVRAFGYLRALFMIE